jgi:FKBP-type peptidyl-prolyl cis-trans isomerase
MWLGTLAPLCLAAVAGAAQSPPAAPLAPASTAAPAAGIATEVDRQAAAAKAGSYSLGLIFGGQLHDGGLNEGMSMDALVKGIADGMQGRSVSPEDRQRAAMLLRSLREAISERNHSQAKEFLAKNAAAQGVKTMPSGLQYKVLDPGLPGAPSPTAIDQVTVHYRGRLLNGTEFDSSYSRGQPAVFRVDSVIKGWQEALSLMKAGAKWQLFVPPELAYDTNSPPSIPPGSLLMFDIELVQINPPATLNDPGTLASPTQPPKS